VDDALRGYVDWANDAYSVSYECSSWREVWGAFTWEDLKQEIDADRPLVLLVDTNGDGGTDHFVTAIGWRDVYGFPEYACFDTWSVGGYRWERFRQMSDAYDWGVYSAIFCSISLECPDLTGDALVNVDDLFQLLGSWGPCSGCMGDMNDDGAVDADDLSAILSAWGPCP
jgi:hypothetical protein